MKLTIRKFQEIYQISNLDIDELDKSILLVACLTNKSKEEVEAMNVVKFNSLCSAINEKIKLKGIVDDDKKPKSFIWHKGKIYFVNYDLAKPPMNTGRYVEVATYSDDIIGNLHNIMATMVTPMKLTWKGFKMNPNGKNHKRIAEDMLDLDFNVAYHSAVFFYAVFTKSIQSSITYFTSISGGEKVRDLMQSLAERMDGYITAKWYRNLKI